MRTIPTFGSTDDLMLGIFRAYFASKPEIHIGTLFTEGLPQPIVIVRRERRSGTASVDVHDDRFLQPAIVSVNTITDGADADSLGEKLQEACRKAIREAQQNQLVIPGCGHISEITNAIEPSRVSDWATSTGVVQYASLPKGSVRYESVYRLVISPPKDQSQVNNPFIPLDN